MTGDRSVASVRGDIFHHPDDEVVLDDALACVCRMYSGWDGLSGWSGSRKKRPGICNRSGMEFPVEGLGGKCDPEFAIGVGWSFPTEPQAETASHSEREFWDTVSGCKKGHMTWPSSYMCCGCSHEKPRLNTEASARADEPVKTCRYLILVVPGARLGSVSLASVWKCSVYTFLPSRNIS